MDNSLRRTGTPTRPSWPSASSARVTLCRQLPADPTLVGLIVGRTVARHGHRDGDGDGALVALVALMAAPL
jgi:hypothetical protein